MGNNGQGLLAASESLVCKHSSNSIHILAIKVQNKKIK